MIRISHHRTWNQWRMLFALIWIAATATATADEPILHHTCNSDAQCLQGGTCRYAETGQGTFLQCQCGDGYSGSRCEHSCPLKCQNGGFCRLSGKSNKAEYSCRCVGYFTGRLCETPYENCNEGDRCYNQGTCEDHENDHHVVTRICVCPGGWTGSSCQTATASSSEENDENSVSAEDALLIESTSMRTVLWVFLIVGSLIGVLLAVMVFHRKKQWRLRQWRYNFLTRKITVSKYHDWQYNPDAFVWEGSKKSNTTLPEYRNAI